MSTPSAGTGSVGKTTGASGYAYCPDLYYGTPFGCGERRCAKADAAYQTICELTSSSRPAP